MKMKRVFSGVMASAIAVSGMSAFSASADIAEASVGAASVTGNAGMYFQTDMYTAHDAFGGTWGPTGGSTAAFPNTVVGLNGGDAGWDTQADVPVTNVDGDGTYTVSFKTSGKINTAPNDLDKSAKTWYIDEDHKYSRMGAPWSILGNYNCTSDLTADIAQEDLQWEFATKNRDKAFSFNLLGVTTDIPAYYDKENNKCYLDEAMTKEVTVSDVSVDLCGKEVKVADADVKFECDKYIQLSLINIWGASSMDLNAFPEQDGVVSVTFTLNGLSEKKTDTDEKTDLSKKAKVSVKKNKLAYTGKALKPAVTVKVGSKTLKKGTDYSLSYKNNKKPGKATFTVTGKGSYTGKKSGSFIIVPKKAGKPTVTSTCCGKVTVKVKKDKTATGYKIRYSTNKNFKKGVKTATIKKASTTKTTIKKLKTGKKYYFQVASYVKVGKKTYNGAWSATKAVTVK